MGLAGPPSTPATRWRATSPPGSGAPASASWSPADATRSASRWCSTAPPPERCPQVYAPGMHSAPGRHTANVLGAVVDGLGRDLETATAAAAAGPGGRAAALTALAAFASGGPIDRLAAGLGLSHSR